MALAGSYDAVWAGRQLGRRELWWVVLALETIMDSCAYLAVMKLADTESAFSTELLDIDSYSVVTWQLAVYRIQVSCFKHF